MDRNLFFSLLRSFVHLDPIQLARAQEHLRHHLQRDLLHQALAEHGATPAVCPCCDSSHVIHWGRSRGQQRYRCKACGKTFNQLDGSALAGLHHKHKWAAYADCLSRDLSLRAAARECGINLKTAFRWRHRFLRYTMTTRASQLAGIVEADEIFVPESFKGRRHWARPARHHGGTGHGHVLLVPVLIALDRYRRESDAVLLDKSLSQIEPTLKPLLVPGIIHKRLIAVDKHRVEDEVFHIQTLNNYVSRWRRWMQKFHGVGTEYWRNYLAWFRVVGQEPNTARTWLLGGVNRLTNT